MTLPGTFAATLVDEWARAGVAAAVVSPGSRSAPLARALLEDGRIPVTVRLDERSAAYFALGRALASGRPVLVVTTSGTAAAELVPAVIEADLAGVPLICCTADRPEELRHVGAPQTIEQEGIFGAAVRFASSLAAPEASGQSAWRSLAARAVAEATVGPRGPGPVHLNLAFREPLITEVGPLPLGRESGAPWHRRIGGAGAPLACVDALVAAATPARRGVIVAGRGASGALAWGERAVLELSAALGWPVLEDGRAWPKTPDSSGAVRVAFADHVLRSERARRALAPDVVLRLGSPPASKMLASWLAELAEPTTQLLVDPYGRWADPERRAEIVLAADPAELAAGALGELEHRARAPELWTAAWAAAEDAARGAIGAVLAAEERLSEPALARALYAALPPNSVIVASSSMPVRDLEWFTQPRPDAPLVYANRGANGIDGITSTVLGVASARLAASGQTVGLLGDLAFLYDLSGLVWGVAEMPPPARLVVVDNGGGAIFSFLPYAGSLTSEVFERAFGTPQAHDVAAVAAGLGHRVIEIASTAALAAALAEPPEGLEVLVVRSDREANRSVHERLAAAAASAVDGALEQGGPRGPERS